MLTSVSKRRAFGGTLALPLRLRLVLLKRYADAITDRVGQPHYLNVGRYSQRVISVTLLPTRALAPGRVSRRCDADDPGSISIAYQDWSLLPRSLCLSQRRCQSHSLEHRCGSRVQAR